MAVADRPSVFEPPAYLRNPMLQTFWGSRRPLGRRVRGVLSAARPLILTACRRAAIRENVGSTNGNHGNHEDHEEKSKSFVLFVPLVVYC